MSPVPCDDDGEPLCGKLFLQAHGVKLNKKQGATLSVKKHQGWEECYKLAKQVALWAE